MSALYPAARHALRPLVRLTLLALWRFSAGALLTGYLLVEVAVIGGLVLAGHLHLQLQLAAALGPGPAVVPLWLVWRVWQHRGRVAWTVLVGWEVLAAVALVASLRWSPGLLLLLPLLGLAAAQLVLLVSPAVRRHLRRLPPAVLPARRIRRPAPAAVSLGRRAT